MTNLVGPAHAAAADAADVQQLHAPWNDLLRRHVTPEGRVDYKSMLEEEEKLTAYLLALRKTPPKEDEWTGSEIKAYWLNAYNAAAVHLVLQHYPVGSINDIRIKSVNGPQSPWEGNVLNVGGRQYSLNQMERDQLVSRFHDPRVHFALVQTAASGPPMLNEAYDGSRLNDQLDQQARRFINSATYNTLSPDHAKLSSLFRFYVAEFGDGAQLITFLNRYARVPVSQLAQLEYLPFDWALNDRQRLAESQAVAR